MSSEKRTGISFVPTHRGTGDNDGQALYSIFVIKSNPTNEENLTDASDRKGKHDCYVLPDEHSGNGTSRQTNSDSGEITIIPQTTNLSTDFSRETVSVVSVPSAEKYIEATKTDSKKETYIKTTRRALLHKLYTEATERLMVEDLNVDTVTFAEQSTKYCCRSCFCEGKSIYSTKRNTCRLSFDDLTTPQLRRGQAQGWIMYKRILSPLFKENHKVIWLMAQFMVSLLMVTLSSLNLSTSDPHSSSLIIFALSVLWSTLTIFDAAFVLWKWARSKKCCNKCIQGRQESAPVGNMNKLQEDNRADGGANDTAANELAGRELLARTVASLRTDLNHSVCQGVSDILRLALNEIFTYVLLVCSIVDSLYGQGKTTGSKIGIALLITSGMSLLFFVYLPKVVILGRAIKNVQAIRNSSLKQHRSDTSYDPSVSTKQGLYYQLYLFVHLVLNMLVQIVLLVAIGGKMAFDNKQNFDRSAYNDKITISSYLWCMIVTGYLIPEVGMLTVFASSFYWMQELLIGLCLNLVHMLELCASRTSEATSLKEIADIINKFLGTDRLREDYQNLVRKKFFVKISYSFRTPAVVFVSMIYIALVSSFVISAGVSITEGTLRSQILNGGGWIACYVLTLLLLLASNLYTVLIACFWLVAILACFIIAGTLVTCFISRFSRWCCVKKYRLNQ